jgi:zinc protease
MRILTLLLFLQAAVPAQREIIGPYTFREDQGQTTKVILKNGISVIVREEHAVPLVSITTHFKVGSFDEEERLSGISHVVERMLFDRKRWDEIRSLGGVLRPETQYDRTVYNMTVPAANAVAALAVQSDALWNRSFGDELKREIDLIVQENAARSISPSILTSQRLYETAFTVHPFKRSPSGIADSLRALTADDLMAHYQMFYRPANMILTIVGAVDREKILQEVVRLFGPVQGDATERTAAAPEPTQDVFRYAWRRGAIQQACVALGFQIPRASAEEARALEILAAILGSGRASRLEQIVQVQKNLITSGSAKFHAFSDVGLFEMKLETPSPLEAGAAALAEIGSIRRFGVSAETLARAKLTLAREYYERLETVEGAANELAIYEASGDWKRSTTYLTDLQRITAQRVMEVAGKFLIFENLTVFEYLPESVERYMSAAEYRAAVLEKVDTAIERRTEAELPAGQIPMRSAVVVDSVGTIQLRQILRGPDVHILEDRRLPIVSFGIFFPGGRLLETERNAGITELMLRASLRGAGSMGASELARRLENAGARIEVVNEPDFFGYIINGFAGRMDQPIRMLVDILQNPVFDEVQVANERGIQLARIRDLKDDTLALPESLFMKTLFPDHSYGRPAVGTEDGIRMLTGVQLRQWLRDNMRKVLPMVVIVGDTTGTALVAPIADALTNEDLQPRDILAMPRVQPTLERGESVEAVGWGQGAMAYGFPGALRSSNDRYAFDLLANVFSAVRGPFDELRRSPGVAFTVQTTTVSNARAGGIYTHLMFPPDMESEVRTAIDKEYAKLRQDGLGADELRRGVQYSIGLYRAGLQSRESRVLEYARANYFGGGVQSVAGYGAAMQSVTETQLRSVFERYMDPKGLRLGIARHRVSP